MDNDIRGRLMAECATIRNCSLCRLHGTCKGDRSFLRNLSYLDSEKIKKLTFNKSLKLRKSDIMKSRIV